MSVSRSAAALAGLTLLTSTALQAQTAGDPIVITATRQPERASAQLSDLTVLDRADIERAQGHTLAELLAQQPELQFASYGGRGQAASVFVRGMEARHTLVLIDGMRYGSATLGQAPFENLPLEAIERIEIVRGPMSSLYGSDAAGGVVQIFTRAGREGWHPNASVGAGSHGYAEASAGFSAGQGPWSGALQLQHQRDSGISATNEHEPFGNFNPDRDGFRQSSLTGSLGYRLNADWQLRAHTLLSHGRTHFDDGANADSQMDLKSEATGLDLQGRINAGWTTTLRAARSVDVVDTLVSASPYVDLGAYRSTQDQLSWENSIATPLGSLLLLGEHLRQKVSKPATGYDISSRTINAAAVGLDGHSGIHTWQASVRVDRNSQYGHQTTGNLAYGIDLTPQWRLGGAAGNSFVAPSFNQLYWPQFGNPDLQPEHGQTREISLRWRPSDEHQLKAVAFTNRVRGYITQFNTNVNLPYASFDGASLAYEGRIAGVMLNASYDHVNPRNDVTGQTLTRRAKNSLKLSADTQWKSSSFGATLVANGTRRDTVYDANVNPAPVALAGYTTLDLRADCQIAPEWTVQTRLNNAFDRRYETSYGYNQPGRELFVTLRWAPR